MVYSTTLFVNMGWLSSQACGQGSCHTISSGYGPPHWMGNKATHRVSASSMG
jgi:hypothetical protein